jgi:hypothetical protein
LMIRTQRRLSSRDAPPERKKFDKKIIFFEYKRFS